nr:hypothetical protein [uncultured Draconibacterium sp.]
MKKRNHFSIYTLLLLLAAISFTSCQKDDTLIGEPEIVYDEGDRLILNDQVIILENSAMTHGGGQPGVDFDDVTGVLRFDRNTELGVAFEPDTLTVFHINMQPTAIIRKVTGVESTNNEYVFKTQPGFLHNVFDNANIKFDFDPGFSNLQTLNKNASILSTEELGKMLTDNKGRVHPSEVVMLDGDKRVVLFSARENKPLTKSGDLGDPHGNVGFTHQFNPQVYLPLPITVGLEDFGFSFNTNLKAEFSTGTHKRSFSTHLPWPFPGSVEAVDGAKASFSVTADSTYINIWGDIGVEAQGSVPLVDEDVPLFDPKVLQFTFPVGGVPVMIHVECQLILGVHFELGGELKMVTGLELETLFPKTKVGASYDAAYNGISINKSKPYIHVKFNESFTPHFECEKPKLQIVQRPFRMEAIAKFTHDLSIRPSLGFSLYDVAGPEIALPLHAINVMSIGAGESVNMQDTTEAPRAYIGWGSALGIKPAFKPGVWLDFFGFNKHLDTPEIPLSPEIPIWHTPDAMHLIKDDGIKNTILGQEKEVEVQITDFFGLPAPLMFVMWDGVDGGNWKYPLTMTGITGKTTNVYTPTSDGKHEPFCLVKNGDLIEVGRVTFETTTAEN